MKKKSRTTLLKHIRLLNKAIGEKTDQLASTLGQASMQKERADELDEENQKLKKELQTAIAKEKVSIGSVSALSYELQEEKRKYNSLKQTLQFVVEKI